MSAEGWDCHAHVIGPYARFPLPGTPASPAPEATEDQYLALLLRLGLAHGVLVHPSAYGPDHALLLHVLTRRPQLRGVMVPAPGSLPTPPQLRAWRERGVRGARFSHRPGQDFAGSARLDDLQRLAPRLADAGLHAELWTTAGELVALAPQLRALPVPVVIDHMGGFDAAAGIDAPGFRALRELLAEGRVWVKLCAYRNLRGSTDPDAGRPFQQALIAANPGQLVWGSDWPHLRVVPPPNAGALLENCRQWAGDAAAARRILVDNPGRLYA